MEPAADVEPAVEPAVEPVLPAVDPAAPAVELGLLVEAVLPVLPEVVLLIEDPDDEPIGSRVPRTSTREFTYFWRSLC